MRGDCKAAYAGIPIRLTRCNAVSGPRLLLVVFRQLVCRTVLDIGFVSRFFVSWASFGAFRNLPLMSTLFPRKHWFQRRLRANLGLSLVSLVGLTAFVGSCSWSRLNLDSSSTQDEHRQRRMHYNANVNRRDVRHLHAYTQTSEQTQTVFPGNNTGIARYDTAKIGYVSHIHTFF